MEFNLWMKEREIKRKKKWNNKRSRDIIQIYLLLLFLSFSLLQFYGNIKLRIIFRILLNESLWRILFIFNWLVLHGVKIMLVRYFLCLMLKIFHFILEMKSYFRMLLIVYDSIRQWCHSKYELIVVANEVS